MGHDRVSQLPRRRRPSVLVAEDEYLIAEDLRLFLEGAGARVIGPVATKNEALKLIGNRRIDCAIVDINLRGDVSFDVARALLRLAIPFVFASGYSSTLLPAEFASVTLLEKPFTDTQLASLL